MDERLGKFYVSEGLTEDGDLPRILWEMKFVPLWAGFEYNTQAYAYVGLSPLFEPFASGVIIPKYNITINKLDSGQIFVTAEKI